MQSGQERESNMLKILISTSSKSSQNHFLFKSSRSSALHSIHPQVISIAPRHLLRRYLFCQSKKQGIEDFWSYVHLSGGRRKIQRARLKLDILVVITPEGILRRNLSEALRHKMFRQLAQMQQKLEETKCVQNLSFMHFRPMNLQHFITILKTVSLSTTHDRRSKANHFESTSTWIKVQSSVQNHQTWTVASHGMRGL